jgi:hypothetical protein
MKKEQTITKEQAISLFNKACKSKNSQALKRARDGIGSYAIKVYSHDHIPLLIMQIDNSVGRITPAIWFSMPGTYQPFDVSYYSFVKHDITDKEFGDMLLNWEKIKKESFSYNDIKSML